MRDPAIDRLLTRDSGERDFRTRAQRILVALARAPKNRRQ